MLTFEAYLDHRLAFHLLPLPKTGLTPAHQCVSFAHQMHGGCQMFGHVLTSWPHCLAAVLSSHIELMTASTTQQMSQNPAKILRQANGPCIWMRL